ncbi:amino acid--tRNA ligase-related protein [Streptomyces sp. NPDC059349]|uniref:amino acid--tRNA ligase-related protein n=1 Tax=Streptomyces sp. NPDC059349 TaxID=3346808 RepID=UPI0036C91555
MTQQSERESLSPLAKDRYLRIIDDPRMRLIAKLQDLVTRRTTSFWSERGAMNMHLPITTNTISSPMGLGSDSLPVSVDMFGVPTYLADSMQFMLEYGCRFSEKGAWYLMPSFRGESADESHLNQFFHSEAEILGGLDDVMNIAEDYVRALSAAVLDELADDVNAVTGTLEHLRAMVAAPAFPRLTLDEAIEHLGDDPEAVRHDPGGWRILTRTGEERLMAEISPFIWVTHFDHLSVPFYQAYADENRASALNGDLLFGIGEVIGCGERHAAGHETRDALRQHDVPDDSYDWYIKLKEKHPMQTAGFGLGIERWLMWVVQHHDIRDLQLVPRFNGVLMEP